MTPLIIIFALLAIAAAGAWGLIRHNRARKLAEQRARAESERLATETRLAHEKATADAKLVTTPANRQRPKNETGKKLRSEKMHGWQRSNVLPQKNSQRKPKQSDGLKKER